MPSELDDPDRLIPVLRVMPLWLGGGPLYFRRDVPHAWDRIRDELQMLIEESEPDGGVQIHGERMRVGEFLFLPEHQGW